MSSATTPTDPATDTDTDTDTHTDTDTATATATATATGTPARSPVETLPAAAAPVRFAPAAVVSVLLCLGLVTLGVLAVREALLGRQVAGTVLVPGEAWFAPLLRSATAVVPGTVAALAGAAVALVGLVLLVLALRPRRVRTLRLVDPAGRGVPIDLDPADVGDLAADTALDDGEVGASRARSDGRRIGLHLTVDPRDPHDVTALTAATVDRVSRRLVDVHPAPRVLVTVHGART